MGVVPCGQPAIDSALPVTSVPVVVSLMPYHVLWLSPKSGVKNSCVLDSQVVVPVTAVPAVEQAAPPAVHGTRAKVDAVTAWFMGELKLMGIDVAVEMLVLASAGTVEAMVGRLESVTDDTMAESEPLPPRADSPRTT